MKNEPTVKIVKIKDIGIDEKLYPRSHVNYQTMSRYVNAIQAGANLPPICLAKTEGSKKYTLIDGRHRMEAMKGVKEEYIQANVYDGLTKKEIFVMAVELNTIHGKPFDAFEVVNIAEKLKTEFKMTREEVSEIIRIPVDRIDSFVAKRTGRILETGEPFTLKKPLYDFAGVEISQNDSLPSQQRKLDGIAQIKMIQGVITLVKGDYISKSDESVEFNLKKLFKLLKARYENGEENINKLPKPKEKHRRKKD